MGIFSGIKAVVSLGSALFGGDDEGRGRSSGGSDKQAFLASSDQQMDAHTRKLEAQREASRQEQEKTAEELAVEAFKGDTRLTGANNQQQQAQWQIITDTMQNG